MDQTTKDFTQELIEKETWSAEDHRELIRQLSSGPNAVERCRALLTDLEAAAGEIKGTAALKIGILRYILCKFSGALDALNASTDNKDRRYFQALCYKSLHEYGKAAEEFERAQDRGWDPVDIKVHMVELQALRGDVEGATAELDKLAKKIAESANLYYLRGLVAELAGLGQQALDNYEKAHSIDPAHAPASFHLAYCYDLHGDEQRAIELYTECTQSSPVHANALLNLAVLYEDAGQYNQAIACLRRILVANPAHKRARLFLKDCEASKTMYYDEDQAKRIAKRNAVLDIPVTDFELSVRARNCLKKMNIRTLGDLVNITETELLSYKNFGETSLKEIKDILTSKNLRLGQALEDDSELADASLVDEDEELEAVGVRATPIEKVEFSVRARRALESLKIKTLGDLASKSEAELMTCRNFGQTSLIEIRQRLSDHGLSLRDSS